METRTHQAVVRAIESMRSNLGDQLTIDDLARTAMFSKFYFCRIFQEATGVSPGRYLTALRLAEAKRLLVSTSLSVTEISNQVGYTSLGTFSSRFKSMVGDSPSFYRQRQGSAAHFGTSNGPCFDSPVTVAGAKSVNLFESSSG